ncbi:MAG: KpsF/GutQ family sugar-phosphate isomerase [Planctomycetaceae bacterium]|nr:KpsF/GutQ family sugar-phosphate isomerase [Planctomycetaceae bacterium]
MSLEGARATGQLSVFEQLRFGREILLNESEAIRSIAGRLGRSFCRAADLLFGCRGSLIVSGMGKAGLIGRKLMATFASTGTPSHFLHPAEAVHGDLGRLRQDDVVLILSQSGETEEILRLLPSLVEMGVPIIAMTAREESTLGRTAAVVLELGALEEAGNLRLAPSTSTTTMLALGDALALVVSRMRGFAREDFARFHPAGALGRKLSRVGQYCRPLQMCRVADDSLSVREVFVQRSMPGRRTGAIMLVDGEGRLTGLFTDSDLARLFEHRREETLDQPIRGVMTRNPITIQDGAMMTDAVVLMAGRKISELPVVDADGRPTGLIDVTDVVGLFPQLEEPVVAEPAEAPDRIAHDRKQRRSA